MIHNGTLKENLSSAIIPPNHHLECFKHLASIYTSIKENKNIKGDILVETAKDETVIIGKVEWDIRKDEGWGWCGREGDNHMCNAEFVYIVEDDDNVYTRLVEAFGQNRVAGFARVIMLNPIHKNILPFVVLLQAVCNKFDHAMVRDQWNIVTDLYNQYLVNVLGPLVGHSSDGDSRRRKLHLETLHQ